MSPQKRRQNMTCRTTARRREDWSTLPPGTASVTRRDRYGLLLGRRRAGVDFAFDQVKVDAHRLGPRDDAVRAAGLGDAAEQRAVFGGEFQERGLLAGQPAPPH